MKLAVQILYFDCEQFIFRTLENCYRHVDKIYVLYSPEPWSAYNINARELFSNPSNLDVIKESKYFDKIEILEGLWDTEEDQRNDCVRIAKEEGFDYLIIQDADEFYSDEEYVKNLNGISCCPDKDFYRTKWFVFWKDINTIVEHIYPLNYGNSQYVKPYRRTPYGFNACFAINLSKDIWFESKRRVNSSNSLMLNGVCCHLSYVLSDEQLNRKLSTWGHSNQVNISKWLNTSWKGFNSLGVFLHPINPSEWITTSSFKGSLPKELMDFRPGYQQELKLNFYQVFRHYIFGFFGIILFFITDIRYIFKK